jgi:hypothetical protein
MPGGELLILPVAWITGPGWLHRIAASLFDVTGQAPTWNERFLEPIRQAGFMPQTEFIQQKNSQILIIKARRTIIA